MKLTRQPQIPTPFVKGFNPWVCWYPALGNQAVGRGNPIWQYQNPTVGQNIAPRSGGLASVITSSNYYTTWQIRAFSSKPIILASSFIYVSTGATNVTAALGDAVQGSGGMFSTIGSYFGSNPGVIGSSNRLHSDVSIEPFEFNEWEYEKQYNIVLAIRNGGVNTLWMNGKKVTYTSIITNENTIYQPFGYFSIGAMVRYQENPAMGGTPPWLGNHDILQAWCDTRDPGDDWLREWSINPWGIFAAPASFLPTETYVSFTPVAPTGTRRRYIFIN